jgi:hypothetical protein
MTLVNILNENSGIIQKGGGIIEKQRDIMQTRPEKEQRR